VAISPGTVQTRTDTGPEEPHDPRPPQRDHAPKQPENQTSPIRVTAYPPPRAPSSPRKPQAPTRQPNATHRKTPRDKRNRP